MRLLVNGYLGRFGKTLTALNDGKARLGEIGSWRKSDLRRSPNDRCIEQEL